MLFMCSNFFEGKKNNFYLHRNPKNKYLMNLRASKHEGVKKKLLFKRFLLHFCFLSKQSRSTSSKIKRNLRRCRHEKFMTVPLLTLNKNRYKKKLKGLTVYPLKVKYKSRKQLIKGEVMIKSKLSFNFIMFQIEINISHREARL